MKRILFAFVLTTAGLLKTGNVTAQAQEIEQLILDVEKLSQLKSILSDMKKGYEIVSGGYNTIKDLSQGNFTLHKAFLDGLMAVSPTVRNYKRVADIINMQVALVKEYKRAYNRFKQEGFFNAGELDYMGRVYSNLLDQSTHNLDALTTVITANQLRMSDDERLKAIDNIYGDMQEKLTFLRQFNSNTSVLAIQRAREQHDVTSIKNFYGIKN